MSTTQNAQEMMPVQGEVVNLEGRSYKSESLTRTALRRLSKDYLTLFAIAVVLTLAVLSILAPVISDAFGVNFRQTNAVEDKLLPIGSPGHPLGTDNLGRDLFSRLLYGGQVSLGIAFSVGIFSTTIGVTLGLLAGFYQGGRLGFIDDALMWFITTLTAIPNLMLLILIASVLRPTVSTLILVLTFTTWAGTMRLIRGETISARSNEYIVSAMALGAGPLRIMFNHILPNTLSVLITSLAIEIGIVILVESGLSFLGLGVRPPTPSWGNMLQEAQAYFRPAPHMAILPGLVISITVLSLYLIGDGLRDAFDPRSTK